VHEVVLTPEAVERLELQIAFLRDQGAQGAAERLRVRVTGFLSNHLARFPRTGRRLEGRELWEMWIPRTRLVVWYKIGHERIEIATVWHASQDRPVAKP
jgi:plasmid stabilization system protein ParE